MDLKTGKLFWRRKHKHRRSSALIPTKKADVLILGGGLTGACLAQAFCEEGIDTVLLDKRDVAAGSTRASTALIQYEIDVPLHRLIQMRGKHAATRSYELCRDAIDRIERLVGDLKISCGFSTRESLWLARHASQLPSMRKELSARSKAGFRVEMWGRGDLTSRYSFSAPGALRTFNAAQLDPVAFTQALIQDACRAGLRIYRPVTAWGLTPSHRHVDVHLSNGQTVSARRVVVAAGYESLRFIPQAPVRLKSSYVVTTNRLPDLQGWPDQCLIWDAGHPYYYLRSTPDQRLMIGGEDEDIVDPEHRDALLPQKSRGLLKKLKRMFPDQKIEAQFSWAGMFGETRDGLPLIGTSKLGPRVFFSLCYGANGTNFAILAASLAKNWIRSRRDPDHRLFALDR